MIYLNSNKFRLNSSINKVHEGEISDKQTVIKILKEKLKITNYSVYFVNNIYEAYTILIHAIIISYSHIKKKPHIVANKMEDPQLLLVLENFKKNNSITISYARPTINGTINVEEVEKYIQKDKTCLIIISFINYFIGSINNIQKIGELAHKYKIPLFCDCSYAFGYLPIKPIDQNIDVLTFDMNFPGLSFIIINNDLIKGYKLEQNSIRFRPDVENLHIEDPRTYGLAKNIINSLYKDRKLKNKNLANFKKKILKNKNFMYYSDFVIKNLNQNEKKVIPEMIIFGPDITDENMSSPHIMSILRIKRKNKIKNIRLCEIISDIFLKIGITKKWKSQIITIGFSDTTTVKDLSSLLKQV